MPSYSQSLQNASAEELQIICRAITPYNSSNNPPQVLVIQPNDTALVNVLTKYGIIDPISKKPTSSDFGEGKTYLTPGGQSVSYIVPPSLDRLKKSNGDTSVDIAPDKSSGFDGITSLAIDKTNKKTIQDFDDKVKDGYKKGTILPRVIKDPATGNESVIITEYDPEETARQKQRDPNSSLQYKIITPPASNIPTNNTPLGAAISGFEAGTVVSPIGFCASPLSQLSGNMKTLETIEPKDGIFSIGFVAGLNAVAIKALNAAGNVGNATYAAFNAPTPDSGTWGGLLHIGKDLLIKARILYNNANASWYGIQALLDYFNGRDPNENLNKMFEYLYKEYVFVPGYTAAAELISKSVVPTSPQDKSLIAKRPSASDRQLIKNNDPKAYKEIFGSNNSGAVSAEKTEIAREKASEIRTKRGVGRVSAGLQLIGYGAIYIGLPFLEETVEQRRNDKRSQEEEEERRKRAESSGVDQIGIAIQTDGRVMIDDDKVTVKNPITGNNEEITIPNAIPQTSPIITPPLLIDLDDPLASFKRDEPLIALPISKWPSVDIGGDRAPLTPIGEVVEVTPEEPSVWEKAWYSISEFIVDGAHVIKTAIGSIPESGTALLIIDQIRETSRIISQLIGADEIAESLKPANFFKGKEFGKISSFLSSKSLGLITMFITEPITIGDGTILGAMERELKKLEDEVRQMSPTDTPNIRNERLKAIQRLKILIEKEKETQKNIRENKELHSASTDLDLNSNVQLFKEVSVAKMEYDNITSVVDSLSDLGNQLSSGTSPCPDVSLSDINQNVSFVTAPEQADPENPWKVSTPYLNTPFNTEGCFPPYVGVLTENGYKKILHFKVGDPIISFNKDGVLENDNVSEIFIHEKCDIYRYYFDNGDFIDITKDHPVLTDSNVFKNIGDLQIGDYVIKIDGERIGIVKIEFLYNGTVFNLEVKNNHTYISDGIRVHNKLSGPYKQLQARENMRKILTVIEEDERRLYELWLRDQFSESLRDNGDPNIQDYGTVPGTPDDQEATGAGGGGTPNQGPNPYSGPPGVEPSGGDNIYRDSATARANLSETVIPDYLSNK
jgi:hypothetical protein